MASVKPHLSYPMAKGAAVKSRVAKIGLYRECYRLAMALPDKRLQAMTLMELRDKWRENRGTGGASLELQIASCLDRIAYGRICMSKQRQKNVKSASEAYDWHVLNPMENHHKMILKRREDNESNDAAHEEAGRGHRDFVPMTNWGAGNIDPDMVTRHKELNDRQHFMGPHWRGKAKPLIYEDLSFDQQLVAHFSPAPKVPNKVNKQY
jgi:hypothetical protein